MDKINYLGRRGLYMLAICCLGFFFSSPIQAKDNTDVNFSDNVLESKLYHMNSEVDMRLTEEVKQIIKDYTFKWRHATETLLGRGNIFFPIYEKTLKEHSLPMELKFLSVVESGLRPEVRSRVGAVGLWQFMKSTARLYDLKVGTTIDERKDILKSTEAAAKFLKDLEAEFGDWTLALAAYNCGPGNVRKAIRKSGSRDFWTMKPFLPKETQRYVAKFIAVSYVMSYYKDHNLIPETTDFDLTYTTSAKIYEGVNFKNIASRSNVDLKTIKALNPSYLKNYIPKSDVGRHTLTLPVHGMNNFLMTNYSAQIIQTTIVKTIKKRKNIELPLVKKLGMSKALKSSTTTKSEESHSQLEIDTDQPERYEYYKLGKQETLSSYVNSREGVSLSEVMQINAFSMQNPPMPGAVIKVRRL